MGRVDEARAIDRTMKLGHLIESAPGFFGSTYVEARDLFREACAFHRISITEYRHPLRGPQNEDLAVDVALLGHTSASNLLIVVSGTHGLEGLAGSGCQVAWLRLSAIDLPTDTAVLLVHLLNPWGCAWGRQQTEDNADLGRNFWDFTQSLPVNSLYERVHGIVVNRERAVRAADDPAFAYFRKVNGLQMLAAAMLSGQYQHSDGVGFGGSKPSWSNTTFRTIVSAYASRAKRVVLIDVHTGLGPFGYGNLLSPEPSGSPSLKRARSLFGPAVASVHDNASVPYTIHGNLLNWISNALTAEVTTIAVEFGSSTLEQLLDLQVDDCRLHNFHDSWAPLSQGIRSDLIESFFPATSDWLQSVMLRTLQLIQQALSGMPYLQELP